MTDTMTRREFVRAAVVLGAGAAVVSTTGCTTKAADKTPVPTPSTTYGGDPEVNERILVGYATRTGATTGVAEAISEVLGERGYAVDLKPLREKPSVDGYAAVVLGSAVNGGAWLPEAQQFVQANRTALAKIPTSMFCVHIMNLGDDEKHLKKRLAYLDGMRALVEPSDEAFFAGVGPKAEDTSLIARWAFKAFGGGGEGDCRDWDAIRSWARQLEV